MLFSMSRFAPPALSLVADPKMLRDQQRGSEAYSQHDKFLPWWVTTWKPTGGNGSKLKEKVFSFSYSAKNIFASCILYLLGKPSCKKSAVFFKIVQKAFDPPPPLFEHLSYFAGGVFSCGEFFK